jgi:hypothetical protein
MSIFWTDKNKSDFITKRESEDAKLESLAITILGGMILAIGIIAMFFFLFLS